MPTAVERIALAKWDLVGSVMIGPFRAIAILVDFSDKFTTTPTESRSLTLIHRFGPLSSQIRNAMLKKTILPKVEIETPHCTVTLVNAQIVGIVPHFKGGHSEGSDTHEQTEIAFSFQKIEFIWTGSSTTAQDDWSAQS